MTLLSWSVQHKRDTAANWTSVNPVLKSGQIGIETDTNKFKFGTGANWNSTAYVTTPGSVSWGSITGTLTDQTDLTAYIVTHLGKEFTETGSPIFDFSTNAVIGSISSPITTALTKEPVQLCGLVNILIHQSITEPTWPSGFVKESGNYASGEINIIKCQSLSSISNDVIYSITQLT